MKTFFNAAHQLHAASHEFHRGKLTKAYECPSRAELILKAITTSELGPVEAIEQVSDELVLDRIHEPEYLHFLENVYAAWADQGGIGDALPHAWIGQTNCRLVQPKSVFGQLGFYASDAATPIVEGSWRAAQAGAQVATSAAQHLLQSQVDCFGLTRPPGHHAGKATYGGYCFLNNAAIAAQFLLDSGAKRVAIFDVDFHHGNGTQQIFYDRSDVLFVSIHGHPDQEYPYFLGYENEVGESRGEGYNLNLPLAPGSDWSAYRRATVQAMRTIDRFQPDYLVVSLGVDTFEGDPISTFRFTQADFERLGGLLSECNCPALFLMEGGYALKELGANVLAVLSSFESLRSVS